MKPPILTLLIVTALSFPVPGISAEEQKDLDATKKYDRMEKHDMQHHYNSKSLKREGEGGSSGSSSTPQSLPNPCNINPNLPECK